MEEKFIEDTKISIKKNLSCVSQVEFFDENVRVGQVPHVTPRNAKKQIVSQNDRYKEMDHPKTAKNQRNPVTINLI